MKVLIIGGTGFIGPYVARELVEMGHDVTVFHRGLHEPRLLPSVWHIRSADAQMPILNFPLALLDSNLDVVIHMLAMGEADAQAAVKVFTGRAARIVVLSSGDVYRAYGRFTGIEPGEIEPDPLTEDSPLRSVLYPYRAKASSLTDLNHYYEKILVERNILGQPQIAGTVLRLPKVYGAEQNADLATVYTFREHSNWRWTHGYVENVASAIALAATHSAASNRIYNVGESYTPTVAERLRSLPPAPDNIPSVSDPSFNFSQNIVYDTTKIQRELGYNEHIDYEEGIRRTLTSCKC